MIMNEMQQQNQGMKTEEISIRRCNNWISLSCCPQNKNKRGRGKKQKIRMKREREKQRKSKTHIYVDVYPYQPYDIIITEKLSSDWGLHLFR